MRVRPASLHARGGLLLTPYTTVRVATSAAVHPTLTFKGHCELTVQHIFFLFYVLYYVILHKDRGGSAPPLAVFPPTSQRLPARCWQPHTYWLSTAYTGDAGTGTGTGTGTDQEVLDLHIQPIRHTCRHGTPPSHVPLDTAFLSRKYFCTFCVHPSTLAPGCVPLLRWWVKLCGP